jgi:hypothetical protein
MIDELAPAGATDRSGTEFCRLYRGWRPAGTDELHGYIDRLRHTAPNEAWQIHGAIVHVQEITSLFNRQSKIANYCSFRHMSSPADPRASTPRVAGGSVATLGGALCTSGTRASATGPVSPARIGLLGSVS